LDLLSFLVRVCLKTQWNDDIHHESHKLTSDDLTLIKIRAADFRLRSVADLIDLSRRDPFVVLSSDRTLKEAITHYLNGIHRIAVCEPGTTDIFGVLTQMDILNNLDVESNEFVEHFPELNTEIWKSQFKNSRTPITVPYSKVTINAFLWMYFNRVTSVGVVTEEGKLWSVLSVSDLKALHSITFDRLTKSLKYFIPEDLRKALGQPENLLVQCKANATVKDVIHTMKTNNVHRVFIVDSTNVPIGIVTLTDLLSGLSLALQKQHGEAQSALKWGHLKTENLQSKPLQQVAQPRTS